MSELRKETEGTTLWVAGMRLVGERELSPDERMEIRNAAISFAALGCGAALVLPFLILLLLLTVALAGAIDAPVSPLTALGVLALLTVSALLGYAMHRWVGWARQLARDARQGRAELFEGEVDPRQLFDRTLRRLRRSGLLRQSAHGDTDTSAERLEVLPGSNLVWRVNGGRPRGWIQTQIRRVADVPPFAAVAAEWLDRLSLEDSQQIHVGQRELSTAERGELEGLARHLMLKPTLVALGLLLWLGGVLGYASIHGTPAPGHPPGTTLALCILTGVAMANLMRSAGMGLQFRRDLALGRVIITRSAEFNAEKAAPKATELSPPEEFLPNSRVMWSRAGRPAVWRTTVQG